MQHQSPGDAGCIPDPNVHTHGNKHATADEYTNSNQHADKYSDTDDHTFTDSDHPAATVANGSNFNGNEHADNHANYRFRLI